MMGRGGLRIRKGRGKEDEKEEDAKELDGNYELQTKFFLKQKFFLTLFLSTADFFLIAFLEKQTDV